MSDTRMTSRSAEFAGLQADFARNVAAAPGIVGNLREPLQAQMDFVDRLRLQNSALAQLDKRNQDLYQRNDDRFKEVESDLSEPTPLRTQFATKIVAEAASAYIHRMRGLTGDVAAEAERTEKPISFSRVRSLRETGGY